MLKYQIKEVSKIYKVDKEIDFYALKNISLTIQGPGFISIVGKSGSGKSTILNLLCGLDKANAGWVLFNGEDISRFNKREKNAYFKKEIGILFQNYNLLENESVLFNVTLPMVINGENKRISKRKATAVLKMVGLDENNLKKKANVISGGEKQRVGLARTLVNEPNVLLCDEPTGHLDSKNSLAVMEILKKYSEKHLVILVSHNLPLVRKYADRIIEVENGRIKSDTGLIIKERHERKSRYRIRTSDSWVNKLTTSDFKRCFKRNLFSFLALSISLTFSFLSFGFINGKDLSVKEAALKQFDFGVGVISKEEKISESTLLSLSRSTRPEMESLLKEKEIMQNFHVCPNFDAIIPPSLSFSIDETVIDDCFFFPVYSFDIKDVNESLFIEGKMNKNDLDQVIVNKKAYELIKTKINDDPFNKYIDINHHESFTYVDFDETYIIDDFYFLRRMKITGVIDELDYLSTPKVYYSYSALEAYLSDMVLPNLSTYFDYDITWYDRIMDAEGYNPITSYSFRLFPKDTNRYGSIYDLTEVKNYSFSSPSLLIKDSLLNFMQVAEYGLIMFLIVSLIGSVLILGIMSFTSYSENHRVSAILTCLGAKTSEISDIYLNQNVMITLLSLFGALVLSFILQIIFNPLIGKWTGLNNLVKIPLSSFLGIPFLFPLLGVLLSLMVSMIVTIFPILFSKKIQLKEELQSE